MATGIDRACSQRFGAWRSLLWKSVIAGVIFLPLAIAALPELPVATRTVPRLLDLERLVAGAAGVPVAAVRPADTVVSAPNPVGGPARATPHRRPAST